MCLAAVAGWRSPLGESHSLTWGPDTVKQGACRLWRCAIPPRTVRTRCKLDYRVYATLTAPRFVVFGTLFDLARLTATEARSTKWEPKW